MNGESEEFAKIFEVAKGCAVNATYERVLFLGGFLMIMLSSFLMKVKVYF